ncbi:MAG: cyanophycinase [Burkholderiales bacterium]|nr:cyanophycinase [Burkholderiales bacterium]
MRLKSILSLAFCGVIASNIAFASELFLMGGAISDTNSNIYTALAKATGKVATPNKCSGNWVVTTCPKIAIITSAAANQAAGDDAYSNDASGSLSYQHLYSAYGFSVKHISAHIDNYQSATNLNTAEGRTNQTILEQADVVFFNGGDQARHARTWLNDEGSDNALMKIIYNRFSQNKLIVAGTSAGTAIQSNPTYGEGSSFGQLYFASSQGLAVKSVKDGAINGTGLKDTRAASGSLQYLDNGGKMPGFGLSPSNVLVDTHFDARGRLARLIPALHNTSKQIGAGVDEDTAFFIKDGVGTVYGTHGVFIVDNRNASYSSANYFAGKNFRVSYLTKGDEFIFDNSTVVSTKKQISKPYYSGHKDSNNITASYETTTLITRLVDQLDNDNIGYTKAPSDYPRTTPKFKLYFYKDSQTKGYYTDDFYTVSNALLDISN